MAPILQDVKISLHHCLNQHTPQMDDNRKSMIIILMNNFESNELSSAQEENLGANYCEERQNSLVKGFHS